MAEQADLRAKTWENLAQISPENLNPNPPLGCKIVQVKVVKSGLLPNGETVAHLRYGKSILPAQAANAEERRANEEAAKLNPRGSVVWQYWGCRSENFQEEAL